MMGYEIDYLPVGDEESKSTGDAIGMRFWDEAGTQVVLTVDGGTLESSLALTSHIKEYYATDKVLAAILTHPDADHASGLRVIIEELNVRQLTAGLL